MRILITGATGFIGSRLALAARDRGHEVVPAGLTNTEAEAANRRELEDAGLRPLAASVEELAAAASGTLRGCDAVVHLAAAQHEVNVPDEHFRRVNVEGTRLLLDAARGTGPAPPRFVYGSTIGVYGAREGLIDEATPTAPDNVYGRSKLEAERLVLARAGAQPVAAVRISETYGPGDRRLLKLFRAIKKGRFLVIGSGRNLHHPIYVDDLVEALLLAAARGEALGEVVLAAGRDTVTTDEVAAAVAAAVGRPAPRLRAPLAPFMAAASVMESALRPLGVQPPLHRRRMDFFRKSFHLSGDKARRLLGFEPRVGFREGAERTARWYERAGLL
jgi:dihydroflavonol-4-reductase